MTDTEKRIVPNAAPEDKAAAEAPAPEKPASDKPAHSGFEHRRYNENEVIFEEGEPGNAAFMITRGKVEIRKGMKSSNPVTLAFLNRNDIFGEMALFDSSPRMAEAVARSPVEVITISREEFLRRLDTVDPVMRTIVMYLVGRVRSMANEFMRRKDPHWGHWKKD